MEQENKAGEVPKESPQTSVSNEELEQLRQKAAKSDEYLDLLKRERADFINYQDRVRREKEELRKYAVEAFLRELLPTLDYVQKSLETANTVPEAKSVSDGLHLAEKELLRLLAKHGVKPMNAIGKPFNPHLHEAVSTVETEAQPEMTVLAELVRGYTIHDRVLRPAQVQVAKKPKKTEPPAPASEKE